MKNSYNYCLKFWVKMWYHSHLCGCLFSNVLIHITISSPRVPNGGIIFWFNIVREQEWLMVVDHMHREFHNWKRDDNVSKMMTRWIAEMKNCDAVPIYLFGVGPHFICMKSRELPPLFCGFCGIYGWIERWGCSPKFGFYGYAWNMRMNWKMKSFPKFDSCD